MPSGCKNMTFYEEECTMNIDQIISIVVAILTGLAACIPLAAKLVQCVKQDRKSVV